MTKSFNLRQPFSSVCPFFPSVEQASSPCAFVNMLLAGAAVAVAAVLLSLSISVLALVLLVLRISILVLRSPKLYPRATTPPLLAA